VTRKDPTAAGKYQPGVRVLRLVDADAVDSVYCWKWDRFIREPLDLEYLIPRFDRAGVRFAEAEGTIDLGTDSGRLAARILVAIAKPGRSAGPSGRNWPMRRPGSVASGGWARRGILMPEKYPLRKADNNS
jgi:site-specific DNA recombinase